MISTLILVCVFVVYLIVVDFFFLEGLSWIFLEGEKRKKNKKGISAFWFPFVELECLKLEFQANFH